MVVWVTVQYNAWQYWFYKYTKRRHFHSAFIFCELHKRKSNSFPLSLSYCAFPSLPVHLKLLKMTWNARKKYNYLKLVENWADSSFSLRERWKPSCQEVSLLKTRTQHAAKHCAISLVATIENAGRAMGPWETYCQIAKTMKENVLCIPRRILKRYF